MLRVRNLSNPDFYEICVNRNVNERLTSSKVLGIIFTQDLSWNEHIRLLISSYASLVRFPELRGSHLSMYERRVNVTLKFFFSGEMEKQYPRLDSTHLFLLFVMITK